MDYTYDNYGLLNDCGTCAEHQMNSMHKAGIDPCSVAALLIVGKSIRDLPDDRMFRALGTYAIDAIYWKEKQDKIARRKADEPS